MKLQEGQVKLQEGNAVFLHIGDFEWDAWRPHWHVLEAKRFQPVLRDETLEQQADVHVHATHKYAMGYQAYSLLNMSLIWWDSHA